MARKGTNVEEKFSKSLPKWPCPSRIRLADAGPGKADGPLTTSSVASPSPNSELETPVTPLRTLSSFGHLYAARLQLVLSTFNSA